MTESKNNKFAKFNCEITDEFLGYKLYTTCMTFVIYSCMLNLLS